jgi:hypothetical protein
MGKAKRKSSRVVSQSVTPLLAPIQALQNLLSQFKDRGVIIGGVAASLLGTSRYTVLKIRHPYGLTVSTRSLPF